MSNHNDRTCIEDYRHLDVISTTCFLLMSLLHYKAAIQKQSETLEFGLTMAPLVVS